VHKAIKGHGNLEVKVPVDNSLGSRSQTMDSSSKRHLSGLHNNNSNSKMEMNCGKQDYYTKNCRQSQSTKAIKGTTNLKLSNPRGSKELKETRGYVVKHFAFYYNNRCPVHKEAKYNASYWP